MILFTKQRNIDIENKCMDTKGGGEKDNRMNWEIGIDIYILLIPSVK